jgi:peptide/nickel transport system permease protein
MNDATQVPVKDGSQWVLWIRRWAQSRTALFAGLSLLGLILAAILGPWLTEQNPYDLGALDLMDGRLPPGSSGVAGQWFFLGTDEQGRDMFAAILYGLRISLMIGLGSTFVALLIGGLLGLIAGYAGGWVDALIMRIADMQLAFPPILLALILLVLLGGGASNVLLALVAVQWAYYARTTRSAALVERGKEYMQAAKVLGLPTWRILFVHLLPNCLPPLIVVAALQTASAIGLEATLSFLGLGVPVTQPSLGLLIANGFQYLFSGQYWISVFPGLALLWLITSINLVADRLRDLLNPRLQVR